MNDADYLAYCLIDVMRVGHSEMPVFNLDVSAADAPSLALSSAVACCVERPM